MRSTGDAAAQPMPSTVLTEEELFEHLREQRLLQDRRPRSAVYRRIGTVSVAVLMISLVAAGAWGNFRYDHHEKVLAARAEYSKAVLALSAVYDQNQAAADKLAAAVRDGNGMVSDATSVSVAVNGFVDPAQLTSLTQHTELLSAALNTPATAVSRTIGKPHTVDQYRAAEAIVIAQTETNHRVLDRTKLAIADIAAKSGATNADMVAVATTVPQLAAQLVLVNRSATRAARDELTSTASAVQAAIQGSGDLVTALTQYGDSARAVQASVTARTGKPAIQVAATIQVPGAAGAVSGVLASGGTATSGGQLVNTGASASASKEAAAPAQQSAPNAPASSGAAAAATVSPPAAAPAPTPAPKPAAPAPFSVVFTTTGAYQATCAKGVGLPVGGGIAYGSAGTTKQQRLFFEFPYTYKVTTATATTEMWVVYACLTGDHDNDKPHW